ncbi:hypothetical protein CRG98_023434 [Punica granatum]|uniref:Uncharacterized protein n=1 Tax=Punica granatum TaxID=22663 RepID=A0A2I0JKU2_PUNGR|nr:hypothetical protein CRG98_023434 [Punica granatum]
MPSNSMDVDGIAFASFGMVLPILANGKNPRGMHIIHSKLLGLGFFLWAYSEPIFTFRVRPIFPLALAPSASPPSRRCPIRDATVRPLSGYLSDQAASLNCSSPSVAPPCRRSIPSPPPTRRCLLAKTDFLPLSCFCPIRYDSFFPL